MQSPSRGTEEVARKSNKPFQGGRSHYSLSGWSTRNDPFQATPILRASFGSVPYPPDRLPAPAGGKLGASLQRGQNGARNPELPTGGEPRSDQERLQSTRVASWQRRAARR